MPNHVTSLLVLKGSEEQVKKVVERFSTHYEETPSIAFDGTQIFRSEDGKVGYLNTDTNVFEVRDGGTFVGVVEGFKPSMEEAWTRFPDFKKIVVPPDNLFEGNLGSKEKEMCEREGRPNWYDWNIANWGTKWNAYSCSKISDGEYCFDTAWSAVPHLIAVMSEEFPDVTFEYTYADEDTAYNCGEYVFEGGSAIFENIPEGGSKEAYDVYFKINPDYKEDYILVDGNYEYAED
jgi:hypothetical protein